MLSLGYSLAYYLNLESFSGFMAGWKITALAMLAIGGVILLAQILFCVLGQGEYRANAIVSLLTSTLGIIICVLFIEFILPVRNTVPEQYPFAAQYSAIQEKLQFRLHRRSTQEYKLFRGIELKLSKNSHGWPDVERSYTKSPRRIVFIGDSFLEVRSNRNVARLVEDRLSSAGASIEVINLSQTDTGPGNYRYRLRELTSGYTPELIVLFLYESNDFSPNYKFTPYHHEPFHVSHNALLYIRLNMDIPDTLEDKLEQLRANGTITADKEEFLKILDGSALTEMDKDFIYQVVYAFSPKSKLNIFRFPLRDLAPSTLILLTQVWSKLLSPPEIKSGWRAHQSEYNRIFSRPESERLELIAELTARINSFPDVEHIHSRLSRLPKAFTNELIAEPDMSYYLWPALDSYVFNKPAKPRPPKALINQVAAEHLKFIDDMQQTAKAEGARLVVVLIPDAAHVDNDFYSFWKPLIDLRRSNAKYQIGRWISDQLSGTEVATIDLADYADRLQGGYWYFDGHWNEKGNAAAADIISNEMQKIIAH